jgi:UDP-N-acetylmuramoyl-tripeptide--D-alanyl-D-alanine ligase
MASTILPNRATFTPRELAVATGGRMHSPFLGDVVGVTTDSRGDVAGQLFVALVGERFDAHEFVADVAARGARGVLVERPVSVPPGCGALVVDSTLRGLGRLAEAHRRRWGGRLVTIAGAAGKTTTRVAVQAIAESVMPGRVGATRGNLNNLIGVPMTLLGLLPRHEVAVVEIGTNAPGEIATLSAMCVPDVAILTCIGLEHALLLRDLDGIEEEEGEAFRALGHDGVAIGNGDDPRIRRLLEAFAPERRRDFGTSSRLDYTLLGRHNESSQVSMVDVARHQRLGGGSLRLRSRLLGLPGALAAMAGVALVETWLGGQAEPELLQSALDQPDLGETGRLMLRPLPSGAIVVDDCYNANPASMRSSIQFAHELSDERQARLVLVLGDMRELGALSVEEHEKLADCLGSCGVLVAVGKEMTPLVARAQALGYDVRPCVNAERAAHEVAGLVEPDDVILVKGSHGVHMDGIVSALVEPKESRR